MKGNNTLEFNEATMKEIVQHYLDTVMFRDEVKVTVTSVKPASKGYGGNSFEISVETKEPQDV